MMRKVKPVEHNYNLVRQAEDTRDWKFAIPAAAELPPKIDLRKKCPPIFDQGKLGSCTANVGVAAYMMLKEFSDELSRLFLYYEERRLEGTTESDAGATMRSIGKALSKVGVCLEKLWPYVVENFDDDPPEKADADAAGRKASSYERLYGANAIKQYLVEKSLPVMIGIDIYTSFETAEVRKSGIVPVPDPEKEQLLGGHAVLIVGYDDQFGKTHSSGGFLEDLLDIFTSPKEDKNGYFIVRNSWGTGWGDDGYFYLPYLFVEQYAFDFWVLK